MSGGNFDEVIFVLSSDALAPLMLPELSDSELRVVRELARSEIGRFMDGGTNYYMDASFSPERKLATERRFMAALREDSGVPRAAAAIEALAGKNTVMGSDYSGALYALRSMATRFCWQDTESLKVDPSHLSGIATKLVAEDLDPFNVEWSPVRELLKTIEPKSAWDSKIFAAELFDGIEDAVKLSVRALLENIISVAYLDEWRRFLAAEEFAEVCNYLHSEAQAELQDLNPAVLSVVNGILARYHPES